MKSERPNWLIVLIVLLIFAFLVFRRYLSHQEKQEKQKTKRFFAAMQNLVKMYESGEQTKKVRAMGFIVRNDKGKVVENTDFEGNKLQDELSEVATVYVVEEFKEIFSEKVTPVCESDSGKQIKFPKKGKGASKK